MICPVLNIMPNLKVEGQPKGEPLPCVKEDCAWWNERFGMCCVAVDAYLEGQEDRRLEREMIRRGG